MPIELLSVHFPKSAGKSLLRSLETAYGATAILTDYSDDPADPCSPFNLDPDGCLRRAQQQVYEDQVRVIHGHFHISKYAHLRNAKRITFLRHPLKNLLSIYFFWKTLPEGHALFNYCRDHKLDILEFARIPLLRYLLSRTYFGNVDLTTFDFVGTTENYAADIQKLACVLGVPLAESTVNVTGHPDYPGGCQQIMGDEALMAQLREILAEDIHFYEQMVASLCR
jgi:hypothetical protein